jgi:murein DD-endopeptidase MepM/ murein hydrolase activator NlpD
MFAKGDVVAVSGNEGASAGPHVHFEIRDTLTEETINPQLFGLNHSRQGTAYYYQLLAFIT